MSETADGPDLPLAGIRVIDLSTGPLQSVGRVLADLGADVVLVEPRGGSLGRSGGVLIDGVSATFTVWNANKRSTVAEDEHAVRAAVATADVLLLDGARADPSALPFLDRGATLDAFPGLVTIVMTDFGMTGPRAAWVGSPAVQFALAGLLARSGLPRFAEPLLPPEFLAYQAAASQAVWLVTLALTQRAVNGVGDFIDFSVLEALVHILDPGLGIAGSARAGAAMRDLPRGRPDVSYQYPIFPVRDGWVRICVLGVRQWRGMFAWLGQPEEFSDPKYDATSVRFRAAGTLYPMIGRLFSPLTREEATTQGQSLGVPVVGLASPDEILTNPAFIDAGAFTAVELGDHTATAPAGWFEIDGVRVGIRSGAPAVGQGDELAVPPLRDRFPAPAPHMPFEGLRVLDLGVIVVGAELGRLFADYGADVIKIESTGFPDGSRQSATGQELSESVAWGHRNKRSLGLNLKSDDGRAVFASLVTSADVVLTNFKPGTLEKLGFGWDELSGMNPRIVLSESSAFGNTGPWAQRLGYGPLVRASAGMSELWRYPEDPSSFSDAITVFPDHVVARLNAAAVGALLLRRYRTGRGGRVSTAQVDAIFGAMADLLVRESLQPGQLAAGDLHGGDGPRGVFPALGDDEWLVVDGFGDDRFRRMATTIGHAEWVEDPRYGSPRARRSTDSAEELHRGLSDWTRGRTAEVAAEALQAAGVPAAPMLRIQEVQDDAHLRARGNFGVLSQPQFPEPLPTLLHGMIPTNLPEPQLRPAPLVAEQSRDVLRDVLGLDDTRIDALIASGAVEEHPSAAAQPTQGTAA